MIAIRNRNRFLIESGLDRFRFLPTLVPRGTNLIGQVTGRLMLGDMSRPGNPHSPLNELAHDGEHELAHYPRYEDNKETVLCLYIRAFGSYY
jgi:hypothetical protein